MNDHDLAAAARHALANLENERELARNALLPREHALSYDALRFIVLSALESLASSGNNRAARKQRRMHAILTRCDLAGEVHKSVINSMAISRRQFYRERHESLVRLADSIRSGVRKAQNANGDFSLAAVVDLGDAREALVEALRGAGQYRQVWEEASSLARTLGNDPRTMECWLVAAEAARFMADPASARRALDAAGAAVQPDSFWRSLWLASGTMSLQWIAGETDAARATLERAVRSGSPEGRIHGKEAVLLAIVLCSGARMEVDCGNWDRARSLLARASALAQNGSGSKRQSRFRLSALISRLYAQLAEHADGDAPRALVSYRAALDAARSSGELGTVAEIAIRYGAALARENVESALYYADYGLDIVRRFYPGDRLCELTLEIVPLLLHARGADAAREAIARARTPGIGSRDALFLDVAEAKAFAHAGELHRAVEMAETASTGLLARGIDAWGCEARLFAIDAGLKLGFRARARRDLAQIGDALERSRYETRARAARLAAPIGSNLLPC